MLQWWQQQLLLRAAEPVMITMMMMLCCVSPSDFCMRSFTAACVLSCCPMAMLRLLLLVCRCCTPTATAALPASTESCLQTIPQNVHASRMSVVDSSLFSCVCLIVCLSGVWAPGHVSCYLAAFSSWCLFLLGFGTLFCHSSVGALGALLDLLCCIAAITTYLPAQSAVEPYIRKERGFVILQAPHNALWCPGIITVVVVILVVGGLCCV